MVGDKNAEGKPIFSQVAPALRVLDMQEVNGKTTLITESFLIGKSKESKPSTTAGAPPVVSYFDDIQIREIYLLQLENLAEGIHRIWKPYVKYRISGITAANADGLCEIAEENGLFGYQFMKEGKLVVKGVSNNYCYLNLIDPKSNADKPSGRTHWGEVRTKAIGVSGYERKAGDKAYLLKDALYPTPNGILIFHDHMATGEVQFKNFKG